MSLIGYGDRRRIAERVAVDTVLIEADERYCEVIAKRLAQDVLPFGGES